MVVVVNFVFVDFKVILLVIVYVVILVGVVGVIFDIVIDVYCIELFEFC